MRLQFIWLAATITLVACVPPATYEVHQAALVPPPAPPQWSGAPESSGVSFGNSTILWESPPHRAEASPSGLYVSKTQLDGRIHLDLGFDRRISVWVPMSYGLSSGSFATAPCLIERPPNGSFGMGLGMAFAFNLSSSLSLGVSLEGLMTSIPMRVETYCVENCEFEPLYTEKVEKDMVGVFRGTLLIGYDFGMIRVFGGCTLRNHPTNIRLSYYQTYDPNEISGEVSSGRMYLTLGGGASFELHSSIDAILQVYQPLPMEGDDIIYGPIAGVSLDVHLPIE